MIRDTSLIRKLKICRTATVSFYIKNHLKSQVEYLRDQGMKIVLISSHGPEIGQIDLDSNLLYEQVEIQRQISPLKDVVTLLKLIIIFRKYRFDIVHSTTPKAGLVSSLAALIAGVPIRLHTWTGQPWVTLAGIKKMVTMLADRLIGRISTRCYADSPSQREFLINEHIVNSDKIKVINRGSLSGIDLERFDPGKIKLPEKKRLKSETGLSESSRIITFIGRVNRDKGILELISAFIKNLDQGYDIDLLIIGPMDQDSDGRGFVNLKEYIKDCRRIHYLGYQSRPERYLAITDIYCLPSYREGFGTTVLEAAAMGVPAVGTRINGLVDAIQDGETGVLVPLKNIDGLVSAFKFLIDNPDKLKQMGINARERCVKYFNKNTINQMVFEEYLSLLKV